MARKPKIDLAGQLGETWIGAGLGISVVHHFLSDDPGSAEKRSLMFKLGDFQFAAEMAYSRLYAQVDTSEREPSERSFRTLMASSADAHSLLVFASGYWRALRDLSRVMPFVELQDVVANNQPTIQATATARNHIEHVTERIVSGRKARGNVSEMAITIFQQSIGRLEFPAIIFGDECFDLAILSEAVLLTGDRIAPALASCFQSGIDKYIDALLGSQ